MCPLKSSGRSEDISLLTTRMLINAQSAEQLRVAVVEGKELKDYQFEITDKDLCRGNIYRGVVANVQPSLGAAFIDIGEDRHGFLSVADVVPDAYHKKPPKGVKRPTIDQVLERGKPILVQVTKDAVGLKGSALSGAVAIAGRYLVLTPFESTRGISRKAEDDKSRKKIRQRLGKLSLPDDHGVIVRTNGIEQNQTTRNRDLNALLRLWRRVRDESGKGKGPRLLYSDQDLIVQALRDFLDSKIAEVIVDDDVVHEKAESYMRAFMPRSKTQLIRYAERLPLFTKYRLEEQIDRIYERKAPLPSGGSIVIDGTEALTAIDVNSGRSTQRGNHEESILSVNLEAAKEVARQLRLRDIGGLVVVDFIDMRTRKNQSKLEKTMRDAMKIDKARYSVGKVSPNGLLEINRQRIKQALHQRTHRSCPICHGAGSIPSPEFAASTLLGKVEARVANGMIEKATVAAHPEIADALQNGHRVRLAALEAELDLRIEVISAGNFSRTEERIDYKTREKAVVPKAQAAFSSSDLADSAGPAKGAPAKGARLIMKAEPEEPAEEAAKIPEKKPRKRRRRRKSKAKAAEARAAEAKAAEAAEETPSKRKAPKKKKASKAKASKAAREQEAADSGQQAAPEAPEADPAGNGKPSRSRRRRRGGKRGRKPAADQAAAAAEPKAAGESAPAEPFPADAAPPPSGDGQDWNAGLFDLEPPPPADASAPAADDQAEPKPRRRRSPRRRTKPPAEGDTQPARPEAWQSPLATQSADAATPAGPARRSPLRRDRSTTLRWQWWGGDDADPALTGEPPAGFKDSED